jgi:glucokinase
MNNKPAVVGIDVGGTKTLCVLVDKQCRTIHRIKFKTAPNDGCKEFTRNLVEAARELGQTAKAKGLKLAGVGVGFAGTVDRKAGRILASPNLLCLEGFPISKHLTRTLGVEVALGNDVQMGISGEHKLGAAVGCQNVLGVFFGTGVGGAAIINNQVYRGASGIGGQVGAILAQPVGGPKAALSHGILDRIASKAAIASEALVMAIKDWAPYLHGKVGTDLAKVTWSMLERAVRHKDERIEEMLRARMRVVGIALSSVVNFMNPEMVVLGGGLVEEMPQLVVQEVEHGLKDYCTPEVFEAVKIKPAVLKSDAVAIGSANEALIKFVK